MTSGGRDSDPLASTVAHGSGADVDPDELATGDKLGRYAIVRALGHGAMGVVYEAHDPQLDRRVAIKVVHPRRALEPTGAERLLREARALARLRHPNVVAVHDAGWAGERLFVAMEMVEGTSLGALMRAREDRDWLALFRDAGRGLAAAHAAGILHRDFKPDNVLVATDGRVCVGDFGLAELSGKADATDRPRSQEVADVRLTTTGALIGTPAYMAPEQHAGKAIDARADQFAFCVALWEAVYGERPFDAASLTALGDDVMAGRIRPPPRRHWLEPLLRRGLAVEPAARFASIDELLRAIDRHRARPRRVIAITAIVAGVGAALGLGAILARRGDDPPPAPVAPAPPPVPRALTETTLSPDAPLTPLLAVAPDASAVLFITSDRVTAIGIPDGKRAPLVVPADTIVVGGYFESSARAVLSLLDADGKGSLATWDLTTTALGPSTPLPSPAGCIGTTVDGAPLCLVGMEAAVSILTLERGAWREVATVPDGELPKISPDGTRIALVRASPAALLVVDLRTGAVQIHDAPGAFGVAWSDDDHLLYGAFQGGVIHELDRATGATRVRRERAGAAMIRPLAFRPGGGLIALTTRRSSRTHVLALDGGGQRDVPGPIETLGWTAEGRLVTLDRETLALAALDEQDRPRPFGALPAAPLDASVAGDLLITLDQHAQTCALVARALADGAERWRRASSCDARLTCAADAAAPCLVLDQDGVRILDLGGGAADRPVTAISEAKFPISALSPAGDVLAGVDHATLHLQPLDGGAARSLAIQHGLWISSLAYAHDGRLFVVAADLGTGARGLYAADITKDPVELVSLWEVASAELTDLRIAPDGTAAAFVEMGYQQDLVELGLAP